MMAVKIQDILNFLDKQRFEYDFKGNRTSSITGFSSINHYKKGSITWAKKQSSITQELYDTEIDLMVVQKGVKAACKNQIITSDSKRVFFSIIEHYYGEKELIPSVGLNTFLSPNAVIGQNVIIGNNCTLDGDIIIGDNTHIYHNVSIVNSVKIGENCVIQSGACIGDDGFSYTQDINGNKEMIRHYGGVDIGSAVNIGACTCICRGTLDNTVIGDNCKLDNLCHIAHNAILDNGVTLIAGTLVYGSVHIQKNAYVASSMIKNQLKIGQNAVVGMGSVVLKNVKENEVVAGVPIKLIRKL